MDYPYEASAILSIFTSISIVNNNLNFIVCYMTTHH